MSKESTSPSRREFLTRGGLGVTAAALWARLGDARQLFAEELASAPETGASGSGAPGSGSLPTPPDLYSLDAHVTYLNHASIGTIPTAVTRAHQRYLEICEGNPWLHIWGDAWQEPREEIRRDAADLLGCSAGEVALIRNTTEAFNVLAHGLDLEPGSEVLFSSLNHSGASVCWHHGAEQQDFRVRRFDFPLEDVPGMSLDDVVEIYRGALSERTRVLILPHIDNTVGLRHPVAEIATMARGHGVEYIAVDGAQSVGMLPLDVSKLNVDAYATSAHKWLQAPKGLGLLYVRQASQPKIRPLTVSWGQSRWADSARQYEDYGTRDLPALLAMGDAIKAWRRIDPKVRVAHHQTLWQHCQDAVDAASGKVPEDTLRWRSPRTWQLSSAIHAVEVGVDSHQLFQRLFSEHGFVFRPFQQTGLNSIRISPNTANHTSEIDRLLAAFAAVNT